jgi:hypothetical protein
VGGQRRHEEIAEEIRAIKLLRSAEQHVVCLSEIRNHHPWFAEWAEEQLHDGIVQFDQLFREESAHLVVLLLVLQRAGHVAQDSTGCACIVRNPVDGPGKYGEVQSVHQGEDDRENEQRIHC